MRERERAAAPRCPFCEALLQRPKEVTVGGTDRLPGGACSCGAIYLVDQTGKNVGAIMALALGMAAEALGKSMADLVPDEDYKDAVLSYDWRTHRSSGISTGYMDGYGRLYIVKVKKR